MSLIRSEIVHYLEDDLFARVAGRSSCLTMRSPGGWLVEIDGPRDEPYMSVYGPAGDLHTEGQADGWSDVDRMVP